MVTISLQNTNEFCNLICPDQTLVDQFLNQRKLFQEIIRLFIIRIKKNNYSKMDNNKVLSLRRVKNGKK